MSLYIVEWSGNDLPVLTSNDMVVLTSLKAARRLARSQTFPNETVRIFRVTGLHPVPISPSKEMNQSDVLSQSEPC